MARVSMTKQISDCFNAINSIGKSKYEHKKLNGGRVVKGVFSIRYMRDCLGTANEFKDWVRQNHGLKSIYQLKAQHHREFITYLKEKGATNGRLINVESHLKKLQEGMNEISRRLGKESVTFFEERQMDPKERELPKNRSFTREEIRELGERMSPNVRFGMELALETGLREREIANLRVCDLDFKDSGDVSIRIENPTGVTKGGRFRDELAVKDKNLACEIRLRATNRGLGDRLVGVKETTLRKGLERACERSKIENRGFHGFRHTYAREQLEFKLRERFGDRYIEARQALNRMIENRDAGVKVDRGFTREERELVVREVQRCVNEVHHQLGHGDNRWTLMATYMR